MTNPQSAHSAVRVAEIAKRRTFAIISHPDAGKTTLTEKFLLYGGAVDLAGMVRAKRHRKSATSDWLEIEKARGISVSTTVLPFEYNDYFVNLLDTPGHDDFSADTYRTLTAVDCVVMLIDYAKGVEEQTRKLFAVASARKIPIVTFVNKVDHPGPGPLDSLHALEDALGIRAVPFVWPLSPGHDFRAICDLESRLVHMYEKPDTPGGKSVRREVKIEDPLIDRFVAPEATKRMLDEIELLREAGDAFNQNAFDKGQQSPVFFGSALHNVGTDIFLNSLLALAPRPQPRDTVRGPVKPTDEFFSGFAFKVQANLDPQHRDRVAFVRIVSGTFRRGMSAIHEPSGRAVKLSHVQRVFGRERETLDVAYPGDIVGISGQGQFRLGDTITEASGIVFHEVPDFPPEVFATFQPTDPSKYKNFEKGLVQLEQEGMLHLFKRTDIGRSDTIVGVVGPLQLEVVQHRIEAEYGVRSLFEKLPHATVRWVHGNADWPHRDLRMYVPRLMTLEDVHGRRAIAFADDWIVGHTEKLMSAFTLTELP